MRLIPVLDLKQGVVVRGVGGRRDEYRAVESRVARSADPLEVANSLHATFGFREFYLADLDAIAGAPPHSNVIRELVRREMRLSVDAGLRDVAAGRALLDAGVDRVIAALESSPGPEQLRSLVKALGPERVTFSVDMKGGALLTAGEGWLSEVGELTGREGAAKPQAWLGGGVNGGSSGVGDFAQALAIAGQAVACGVRSLIVLDLAGVGEGLGVPTVELCRAVRALSAEVEIITGGGVRNGDDLALLAEASVDGVLVASALHDGSLSPAECARWR